MLADIAEQGGIDFFNRTIKKKDPRTQKGVWNNLTKRHKFSATPENIFILDHSNNYIH